MPIFAPIMGAIGAVGRAASTSVARSATKSSVGGVAARTGSVGRATAFRAGLIMGNSGSNESSNQSEPRIGDVVSNYPKV